MSYTDDMDIALLPQIHSCRLSLQYGRDYARINRDKGTHWAMSWNG
jgi:hypothetical protein